MTKQFDEQLCAFMDGELTDAEREQTISRICKDEEIRHRWHSYHLISDTLRNNLPNAIDHRFSQSVMRALENEPTILAPQTKNPASAAVLKNKIAGAAIAASVAAVAVIGVQINNQSEPTVSPSLAQMPSSEQFVRLAPPTANVNSVAQGVPVPALKASAAITGESQKSEPKLAPVHKFHPQLHKYLVDHNQYVAGSHIQGAMPYARIVVAPVQQQGQVQK